MVKRFIKKNKSYFIKSKPMLINEKIKCVRCNKREPEHCNTILCWHCDVRRLIN